MSLPLLCGAEPNQADAFGKRDFYAVTKSRPISAAGADWVSRPTET
jgi:hypothetical protein